MLSRKARVGGHRRIHIMRTQEVEDSSARGESEAYSSEESDKCKVTAREQTVREGEGCMHAEAMEKTKYYMTGKQLGERGWSNNRRLEAKTGKAGY